MDNQAFESTEVIGNDQLLFTCQKHREKFAKLCFDLTFERTPFVLTSFSSKIEITISTISYFSIFLAKKNCEKS